MKKPTIATLFGLILIIGVVTPAMAFLGGLGPLHRVGDDCPKAGISCTGEDAKAILELPAPLGTPNCEDYADYLRGHDAYLGENDDYIFLKASVYSDDPYVLTVDPEGTNYFAVPIDELETWIAAGCPLE